VGEEERRTKYSVLCFVMIFFFFNLLTSIERGLTETNGEDHRWVKC
jgi:hypothetical protein